MAAEENKAVLRRFFEEAWHRKNADVADELFTSDYVLHDPGNLWIAPGPEGIRQMVRTYNAAFPDARFTVEFQLAEGDVVVTRWVVRSTHQGELRGLAATGKESSTSGILFSRLEGGKIKEEWTQWNKHGLLQQLRPAADGAPAPATAAPPSSAPTPPRPSVPGEAPGSQRRAEAATAGQPDAETAGGAVVEANRAVVRRFVAEVLNASDLSRLEEFVAADHQERRPALGEQTTRAGLIEMLALLRRAFPDLRSTELRLIAEGDKVSYQGECHGTHRGDFLDLPPTGKHVAFGEHHVFRIANGQIVEHWAEFDLEGLLRQLGLLPAAAS